MEYLKLLIFENGEFNGDFLFIIGVAVISGLWMWHFRTTRQETDED
jgi:hypothetical protein